MIGDMWLCWLRMVLVLVMAVPGCNGESLSAIYVTGSHFQIGQDIGRTFGAEIRDYLQLHPTLNSYLVPYANSEEGKEVVAGYKKGLNAFHPELMDEMAGIAIGAMVDFEQIFLLNIGFELSAERGSEDDDPDILVNRPDSGQIFIAHNEDTNPVVKHRGYILHAETVGKKGRKTRFTAYCYPGELPGKAFSFNDHGLAFTVNALHPDTVVHGRVCRAFITRALLEASTVEEAQTIMQAGGVGAAYGFSVNIMDMKAGQQSIWNFELASSPDESKTVLSAYQVPDNSWYYHVNLYRRLEVAEIEERITSSVHRGARIKELPEPMTEEDARGILGDTDNDHYPLYRRPTPTDHGCTIATVIIDAVTCQFSVYRDNPSSSEPLDVLPIKCCSTDTSACLPPPDA